MKAHPCTTSVEKWESDERKIQGIANHVHDKISLEKIMMISSKFSFPLDAEHKTFTMNTMGSFFGIGANENKKKIEPINTENEIVKYLDISIALFTQYWFLWTNLYGSKIQFHCRFVEYFSHTKNLLLFSSFFPRTRCLPTPIHVSTVYASLCLSVIYMMLRFN